jgi:DNA-binding winged helix-turn-helix (wHTH) protein
VKLDLVQKIFPRRFLQLHPEKREAEYGGQKLVLGELSYKLLSLLADRAPSAAPFALIEKEVWSASVTRETVKQRVKLLRDDLAKIGLPSGAIEAMRNAGYRLTIDAHKPSAHRGVQWAICAIVGILAIGAAVMSWVSDTGNARLLTLAIRETEAPQHALSPQWMSIKQTITRDLTKLDGMMVLDPTAGRSNRSDLLVTLTPYRQGDQNRYSVQLTDTRTAYVLWAENYGIAGVANDRATLHAANHIQAYVAALGGNLGSAGYPAQSAETQQSYMIALKYWRRGDEGNLLNARARLKRIVDTAPQFELAISLLSRVEADLVLRHGHPRILATSGKRAMQRLSSKHPDFADFRYSLARTMLALGERHGALAELRRAEPAMPFLVRDIRAIDAPLGTAN